MTELRMTAIRHPRSRRWNTTASLCTFVIGAGCIVLALLLQPGSGWLPFLLWFAFPIAFGITGVCLAYLAGRVWLIVLNLLLLCSFPALMFFGTLILGP